MAIVALAGGCAGPLSTLDPAGPSAAATARLWWVMLAMAVAVMGLVLGLLAVVFLKPAALARIRGRSWILWGGLALPATVLSALLAYALWTGERQLARAGEPGAVSLQAVGRQWEWRFGPLDGPLSSGRLVIPAGRPVHLHVTSEDVIHSFWVPRLAGKIDAIPGHVNVIRLLAPVPGTYQGVCAEYCGVGHAAMPFVVEAVAEPVEAGPQEGNR